MANLESLRQYQNKIHIRWMLCNKLTQMRFLNLRRPYHQGRPNSMRVSNSRIIGGIGTIVKIHDYKIKILLKENRLPLNGHFIQTTHPS